MKSVTKLFVAALLIPIISASGVQGATALDKPTARTSWSMCSSSEQEYCVESFQFTPTGGASRSITSLSSGTDTNLTVNFPYDASWTSVPVGTTVFSMPPQISLNFMNPLSPPILGATSDGLDDGSYRVVLRIGEFDPSLLLLTGYHDSYSVTKGADGYYTVDMTVRPIPNASVVEMNGDSSMLNQCIATSWGPSCVPNQTIRRHVMASLMMSPFTEQRAARGSWISTNASMFGTPNIDFATGSVSVNVAGPHYGPADFNLPNQQYENNNVLNPAYFEMFVTYDMLVAMFGKMTGQTLTPELVRQFLTQQASAVQTTIQQSGSEVAQAATTTLSDTGLRINFNLAHYSAPNPKVKFQPSTSLAPASKTAKRGKTVSAKKLVTVPKGQIVRSISVSKSSKKICSATGTSIRMLKKGTCKFNVTVANKKGKRTKISGTVLVS